MKREDGYDSKVDAMLGQFAQIAVPSDVQQRLETRVNEFCRNPKPENPTLRSEAVMGSRRWFVGVSAAACVALAVFSFFALGSRDAWAQVVRTMQSKPWVRFTVQNPVGRAGGEDTEAPEHWLSSKHKVTAFKRGDRAGFIDLARQVMYHYNPRVNSVTLFTSSDKHIVDFGSIETMRRLVSSEEKSELSFPMSAFQILNRTQAEVQEEGHRWTEFTFQCRNPERSPSDYQVTIRVNSESGLPVELRSTEKFSPDQPYSEWKLAIDYPESGPSDIYAMGVPHDATIIDRRNVETENGEEIKRFLAAYRAARGKPLKPSSVEMIHESAGRIIPPEYALKLAPHLMPLAQGYPNIMMGDSPVGNPDCDVTLEQRPQLGPEGTVLLHILVETTAGSNDCYYWIAPDKDYLALRYEIHYSGKDHLEWNNLTTIIDELEQSPEGRWYPSVVRYGRVQKHGDDLSNERVSVDPTKLRDHMKLQPVETTVLRYQVEFME